MFELQIICTYASLINQQRNGGKKRYRLEGRGVKETLPYAAAGESHHGRHTVTLQAVGTPSYMRRVARIMVQEAIDYLHNLEMRNGESFEKGKSVL